MAPKKKPEDTDDVKKAKLDLSKGVRAVGEAAKAFQSLPPRFGGNTWEEVSLDGDWDATFEEFDALDKEFLNQEQAVDRLKQKLENGDIQVRVMKVGPDGGLTDVSDTVSPKDLRPDQIGGVIQTDSEGRELPQGREAAALTLLQRILPGLRLNNKPESSVGISIRRMEATLAESDKILEHWKK